LKWFKSNVPENIHSYSSRKGHGKFWSPSWGPLSNAKVLKESIKLDWNFTRGEWRGRVEIENKSVAVMDTL